MRQGGRVAGAGRAVLRRQLLLLLQAQQALVLVREALVRAAAEHGRRLELRVLQHHLLLVALPLARVEHHVLARLELARLQLQPCLEMINCSISLDSR